MPVKKANSTLPKKKQRDACRLSSCLCHCVVIDMIYLSNPHAFYKSNKLDSGGVLGNKERDVLEGTGGIIKQKKNPPHILSRTAGMSVSAYH